MPDLQLTVTIDKDDAINMVCGLNSYLAKHTRIGSDFVHQHHTGNTMWLRHKLYDLGITDIVQLYIKLKHEIDSIRIV